MSENVNPAAPLRSCTAPGCGSPLGGPVSFCPYCGVTCAPVQTAPVPPVAPPPAPVIPAAAATLVAAPGVPQAAAVELPPEKPVCAERLPPAGAAPASVEAVRPRATKRWPLVAAVALLVGGGTYAWLGRAPAGPDLAAAERCFAAGDYACSERESSQALQQYPGSVAAQRLLAQSTQQQNLRREAELREREERLRLEAQRQHERELARQREEQARREAQRQREELAQEQRRLDEQRRREQEQARLAAQAQALREAARQQALQRRQEQPVYLPGNSPRAGFGPAQDVFEQARSALPPKPRSAPEPRQPGGFGGALPGAGEQQKRNTLRSSILE